MTVKYSIVKELEGKDYQFAGRIARVVADLHRKKESNVERRMRELENEGVIERKLIPNPGGGNDVVAYRIRPKDPITQKLI